MVRATQEMSGLEVMQDIHHRHPEVEIRQHQIDGLDAISQSERDGNPASLVVMAPGLGKTMLMAAHLRRKLLANPASRCLFLNDNNDILNQAHSTFSRYVGEDFSYGLFSGDGRAYDELSVLFGSFQVMRAWHPAFLRNEFNQGMVDESHHSGAPTYKPVLDYFQFDHLLGVTATPDRMDIVDIRDLFGDECFSLPLEEAIAKRLLASVDYHVITDDIVESGLVVDDETGSEFSFRALDRRVFAPARDEKIASIIRRHGRGIKNVRRLGFCNSIEQTERYAELFKDSAAFNSTLSRPAQRRLLESFREGEINSLFTVDMFNEGIDIPDANQIVLLRQTGSKRIFLQQIGRGLRRVPGKSRVEVLDFVDSCEHLLLVDRVWREVAEKTGVTIEPEGVIEIGLNRVHFNEQTRRILPLLRKIADRVYDPAQQVPLGSVRLSTLTNRLDVSMGALRSILGQLKIEPELFPTKRGDNIFYLYPEDADRVERAVSHLFKSSSN